jgi:hypothetical protein
MRGDCVPACEPTVEGEFLPESETICLDGAWRECADLSERPCRCGCGDLVCPPRADGSSPSWDPFVRDEVCVSKREVGEPCEADWQCSYRCSPLEGTFVCVEPPGMPCDASTFCDCEAGADGTGYCKSDCQSRFEGDTCGSSSQCVAEPPLDPNRYVPDPPYTTEGRCFLRCNINAPSCPGATTCSGNGGFGVNESGTFTIHICVGR